MKSRSTRSKLRSARVVNDALHTSRYIIQADNLLVVGLFFLCLLAEEYRAKIPVKMNEDFLADASANVIHLVNDEVAASQEQTNALQEAIIKSKSHLRLL